MPPRARPTSEARAVGPQGVGYVPGWPGAHSQGATEDELRGNLEEVIAMLLEDGEPVLQSEFVGTQTVRVA